MEHLKILRELWAIHRGRNKVTKLTTESWLCGEEDRVYLWVCICVFMCMWAGQLLSGVVSSSPLCPSCGFPLGHSNPSHPHPGTLDSGTVRTQCSQSVWMMQASPAIYRKLFCKVKLWRWLSLSWVGAPRGSTVSCLEAPHVACLWSPHRTQIPMVGDSDTLLMRSHVRSQVCTQDKKMLQSISYLNCWVTIKIVHFLLFWWLNELRPEKHI